MQVVEGKKKANRKPNAARMARDQANLEKGRTERAFAQRVEGGDGGRERGLKPGFPTPQNSC